MDDDRDAVFDEHVGATPAWLLGAVSVLEHLQIGDDVRVIARFKKHTRPHEGRQSGER